MDLFKEEEEKKEADSDYNNRALKILDERERGVNQLLFCCGQKF